MALMGAVLNRSAALTELLLGAGAAAGVMVPPGEFLAMVRVCLCMCVGGEALVARVGRGRGVVEQQGE